MESQRREVTNTFDEVLRVREMEGRRREEELRTNIREGEKRGPPYTTRRVLRAF